jgi:hypothetical protein
MITCAEGSQHDTWRVRVTPIDCQLQARFLFRPSLMFNTWYPHPPLPPHPLRIIFGIMGL